MKGITMEENKQQLAALKKLLDLPHNKQCGDCVGGGGAARASWASINTGVFICMRCAGIHRGLGVHVSKVLHHLTHAMSHGCKSLSTNAGVCICLHCAGIHRGLGVHVIKVLPQRLCFKQSPTFSKQAFASACIMLACVHKQLEMCLSELQQKVVRNILALVGLKVRAFEGCVWSFAVTGVLICIAVSQQALSLKHL